VDCRYAWADGIHFNLRLDDAKLCPLVLIGAPEPAASLHIGQVLESEALTAPAIAPTTRAWQARSLA
jgi:hypothetical protein